MSTSTYGRRVLHLERWPATRVRSSISRPAGRAPRRAPPRARTTSTAAPSSGADPPGAGDPPPSSDDDDPRAPVPMATSDEVTVSRPDGTKCWHCWGVHYPAQPFGLARTGVVTVPLCARCLPEMRHAIHLWRDGSRLVHWGQP